MSPSSNIRDKQAAGRKELESACDLFERGSKKQAAKAFLHAATLGNAEAQVNLANLYENGVGIGRNSAAARYWYKRAIRKRSPEAAYNLSISYRNKGKIRWQRYWLAVAAKMGDKDASEQLKKLQVARPRRTRRQRKLR